MTIAKREPNERLLHVEMPFDKALGRLVGTDTKRGTAVVTEEHGLGPAIENGATGDRFLTHSARDCVRAKFQIGIDIFWTTQTQVADAFGVTRQNVSLHLQNIFKGGELAESAATKNPCALGRPARR